MMIYFIGVMVPLVFVLNGLSRGNWTEAFFFAVAVAVGLTPEMLPMIVSVCLSHGAILMARKRVIVKRLNAIQNLGAMDILCTDKTGTLTQDRVLLEKHCNVGLEEDAEVLKLAYLNSHFQTGLKNLLDRAILEHEEVRDGEAAKGCRKIDEIPFDFVRTRDVGRRGNARRQASADCQGRPESIFTRCALYELDGEPSPSPSSTWKTCARSTTGSNADGFRVLALAYRDPETKATYSHDDEKELILRGYVAFLDPPKESAGVAIRVLGDMASPSRC